jgi:hypothetical protein
MKRAEFEALTIEEVRQRADAEGPVRQGKPEYFDRSWTQLYDEMVSDDAKIVGELPTLRVDVFYQATGAVYADAFDVLRAIKEEPSGEELG